MDENNGLRYALSMLGGASSALIGGMVAMKLYRNYKKMTKLGEDRDLLDSCEEQTIE